VRESTPFFREMEAPLSLCALWVSLLFVEAEVDSYIPIDNWGRRKKCKD